MKLLLDTHTFLWFIEGDAQLSATARTLIEDGENEVYLSVGSLWEMAIKMSLGKFSISQPFETFMPEQLTVNDIGLLQITVDSVSRLISLPFHHRDPFDRLLVVQALSADMPIVGADGAFDAYGVKRLWAPPRRPYLSTAA